MPFLSPAKVVCNDRPACFAPLTGALPSPASPPPRLLWGKDRNLCSHLLKAIAGEAYNRHLPSFEVYDPLEGHLTALCVEGVGNFTLDASALTYGSGIIDCSALSPENSDTFALKRQTVKEEITSVGRLLAEESDLLLRAAEEVVDTEAIALRAARLARRLPRGDGKISSLPILGFDGEEWIYRLPFSQETQIVGLTAQYSLAPHFLAALTRALSERRCAYVRLTNALTDETIGVWLPDAALCYLTDAPKEVKCRQLTPSRFLRTHTVEGRRTYRRLASSAASLEEYLFQLLKKYRAVADKEEALSPSPAGNRESRLQNFRKRLLIELFCK